MGFWLKVFDNIYLNNNNCLCTLDAIEFVVDSKN